MNAPSPAHPAAVALDSDPRTQLNNALQHLRYAGRCASLAMPNLGDHQAAGVAIVADLHATARATARLIDRIDGFTDRRKHERQEPPFMSDRE
jgi:hypothetical protein